MQRMLLENTPGHNSELAKFSSIKLKFLPSITISLTQPVDQPVIADFKSLYTKKVILK
jgi:hypothetical protein